MRDTLLRGRCIPMCNPDALLLICKILLARDPSFIEDVQLSMTDPALYLNKFPVNRGIHQPIPELPWIALVEGLIDRGYLVELNWATAAEDVAAGIAFLLSNHSPAPHAWISAITERWKDADTDVFLQVIGQRLGEETLVLACIDINSDSYPLIIVQREQIVQLQALAQIAGYGKIVEVEALSEI